MPRIQRGLSLGGNEAASRSGSPEVRSNNFFDDIWERLSRIGTQLQDIVPPREIGGDPADVICPARTAIIVDTGLEHDQKPSWIHANVIKFVREKFCPTANASTPASTKKVIAGQSPKTFDQTEKVLIQALDSGNGLVQVVSSEEERARQRQPKASVIEQLLAEREKCNRLGRPMMLAGRYEVMGLADNSTDDAHRHFLLTASDLRHAGQTKTVPLTQIGLDFSDHVLHVAQIEEANSLIEAHIASRDAQSISAASELFDPNILSHAGIGRNAALICYREGLARVRAGMSSVALDESLEEIIAQGRRDRGPKFLQSGAQYHEVHAALLKAIRERDEQSPQARGIVRSPCEVRHVMPEDADAREQVREVLSNMCDAVCDPLFSAEGEGDAADASPRNAVGPQLVPDEVKDDGAAQALHEVIDAQLATPIELTNTPQQRVLTCLREHIHQRHLPIFDALARENIEAAAFYAVQMQRMMMPTEEAGSRVTNRRSMHPDIDVTAPNDSSVHHSSSDPFFGLAGPDDARRGTFEYNHKNPPQPASTLLSDLESVMRPDDTASLQSPENALSLFPQGLAAALDQFRVVSPNDDVIPVEKLTANQLPQFLAMNQHASILQLTEWLAPNNPAAAALVHFLDRASLICAAPYKIQTERFQYVELQERIELMLKCGRMDIYFPTFLAGVDRAFRQKSAFDGRWQMRRDGETRSFGNAPELIANVIDGALEHLVTPPDELENGKLYPLLVYELLAQMTEGLQIPPQIFAHEHALTAAVNENKERQVLLGKEEQQVFRVKEDAYQKQEQIEHEKSRRKQRAEGFNTELQAYTAIKKFPQTLVMQSVDVRIPLADQSDDGDLLKRVRASIERSHDKQAIDNVGDRAAWEGRLHRGRSDMRSWMRVAWLSVLSSLTSPEELESRCNAWTHEFQTVRVQKEIEMMKAIAQYFAAHPRAFMQGVLPEDSVEKGLVKDWNESLHHPARLGCQSQMSYVLDKWLPAHFDRSASDDSIEDFLRDMHRDIAVAFRSTDAGIMPFLTSLRFGYENTGSTLPVVLHRGLGLPIMVIEQGEMDRFTDEGVPYLVPFNDMRVAAPVGSKLAEQIQSFEGNAAVDASAVFSLLDKFNDKPVIWLEHGKYALYLPKKLTRAEDQRDAMPDFDGLDDVARSTIPTADPGTPNSPTYSSSPKAGWVDSARNIWRQIAEGGAP